ncbi:hypothetical protein IEQ34_015924 [Dendrobium chrysotoxum]|uniref:Uncharacterized protein n=1 Tax=Dendrobium chrysotoxum TaxID=161865 RepID=A0AAV7GHR8_DENCH|nr:hypothetical protein IEQ34_015832 [Dendrobium chrysotoxum]KAH0455892.1 hypothetical protein IEQ34_015924 [Dendrobium chrysotoxum]
MAEDEDDEEEREGSSDITQSTRTTTLSTRGTRAWKRRQTTQHRPSTFTSPIRLKMTMSIESGSRSKLSISYSDDEDKEDKPWTHHKWDSGRSAATDDMLWMTGVKDNDG